MTSNLILPSTSSFQESQKQLGRTVSFDNNATIIPPKSFPTEPQQKLNMNVSFDTISIRSYERSLVDHPAVSSGPGLSISWRYEERLPQSVDEFELSRSSSRRLNYTDLVVPRVERERILREECGYARADIASCVRSVNASKHQRRQTINNLPMETCEEAWQRVLRRITRCLGKRRSSDKEIKALWKDAEKSQAGCSELDNSCGSSMRHSSMKRSNKIDSEIHHPVKSKIDSETRNPVSNKKENKTHNPVNNEQGNKIDNETHNPVGKKEPSIPSTAFIKSTSSVCSEITTVTTPTVSMASSRTPSSRGTTRKPKVSKLRYIIAEEEGDCF